MSHPNTSLRILLATVICTFFLSAIPQTFSARTKPQTPDPDEEKELLGRIAAVHSYRVDDLELADLVTYRLINGDQVKRVKAVNPDSGEAVGASFIGGDVVDEYTARSQAANEWREEHGALTPELVSELDKLSADDTLLIAVWLKADIEPLPKPDHTPGANSEATASGVSNDTELDSGFGGEIKHPTTPLPFEEVPDIVKEKAMLPAVPTQDSVEFEVPSEKSSADTGSPAEEKNLEIQTILARNEAFKKQNDASIKQQLAPIKGRFLEYIRSEGLRLYYNSESSPLVFLEDVTLEQLQALSRHPDVDAIYDASKPVSPALQTARDTHNGVLVDSWGSYTGNGVDVAVVESTRPTLSNPYLSVTSIRDSSESEGLHATLVGGVIGSTHPTYRGFAPGADLYFANGGDGASAADMQVAMDWGDSHASILNNSFATYTSACGYANTAALTEIDRHMDFIVRYHFDLATVAAGNWRTDSPDRPAACDTVDVDFVNAPSKGYNSLTVGAFNDQGSARWSDDVMRSNSQYNEADRYKPEMVASGEQITSLGLTNPWTHTANGTSLAAPMVAATAANMVEADSSIELYPEAITAVLMATALHNIEGDEWLSRADGAGALNASAALVSTERGHWASQSISSSTAFPLEFSQFAYAGERVRYVIRWLSNPNGTFTTDPLPVDLDLKAYRADGSTLMDYSISSLNSFEIVDFIAPASENYIFRVEKYGSYSGDSTWLGRGWWRGTYRIPPNTGYLDPMAMPMGTHLSVLPNDWSPTNYWRAMGIRPVNSDHDLLLFNKTIFDDPDLRFTQTTSKIGGTQVDFILADGNHINPSSQEQYVVENFIGSGGYYVNWSNPGVNLFASGFYGPFSMDSSEVVKVFDAYFSPGDSKQIKIIPVNNNADLGVKLYQSSSTSNWYQKRENQVATADISTSPNQTETLMYTYYGTTSDFLGLVVYKKDNSTANFYIYFDLDYTYLPLIYR